MANPQRIGELFGDVLIKAITDALVAQGHRASGRLIDTARRVVTLRLDRMFIDIELEDYYKKLDEGQPAGTLVEIGRLVKWLRSTKFSGGGAELRRAAFLIQRAIFREGSPTEGSLRFSSTGKRTGFLNDAIRRADPKIDQIAERELERALDEIIDKAVQEV